MGPDNKQICRLCLDTTTSSECETIDKLKKEILPVLLIKIDFDINDVDVACNKCLEKLQSFYEFKSHYITTYTTLIVEKICLTNSQICWLCSCVMEVNTINSTTDPDLKNIIANCFPEVDFGTVRGHLICDTCQSTVKKYYEYMKNCEKVEQRIRKYCEGEGCGTADVIILEDMLKVEDNEVLDETIVIKEECSDPENINGTVKNEENTIQFEEIYIKEEELDDGVEPKVLDELMDHDYCRENDASSKRKLMVTSSNGKNKPTFFCPKCPYTSNMAYHFEKHIDTHSCNEVRRCIICNFVTDSRPLWVAHMSRHRGSTKTFGCRKCLFETDDKYALQLHIPNHKDKSEVTTHECPLCSYKSRSKTCLVKHRKLRHDKNMQTYKCDECLISTKPRSNSHGRQLTHMRLVETPKYNCGKCKFETKCRMNLVKHMMIHAYPEVVDPFKCKNCPYQTRKRHNLIKHMRAHSDKRPFSCYECTYSSKFKYDLSRHMLVHQKVNEREMHKCKQCSYQSRRSIDLEDHMRVCHTDTSAVPKFKCTQCAFETTAKKYLSSHMIQWHDKRNKPTLRCPQCLYITTQKRYMQQHLLVHQGPMVECDQCDFRTRYKGNMISHMARHYPAPKSFKCDKCTFCTTRKSSINAHQITHAEMGDTNTYKCATCDFLTKYKYNLKKHTRMCLKKKREAQDK